MTWPAMVYVWEAAGRVVRDVAAAALAAHPAPAAPAVSLGAVALTGAQVRALYEVAAHLAIGAANVKDAEVVADIVIDTALTGAGPVVATLAAPAAEALANLIIERIASGKIKGGSGANADPLGRGGRRG